MVDRRRIRTQHRRTSLAWVAFVFVTLAGCGRTEPAPAAQPEPTAAPELHPVRRPIAARTLGPDDLRPIREITLELPADDTEFEQRKAGPPRTIFSAPHLTFVGDGPVAPGRILVAVKASASYDSPTLETHLVDLDRGSIATFARATRWQLPAFGIAKVFVDIDGVGHPALLHASDGLLVRLYADLDPTTTDVLVNPGRGDGWVFAHDPSNPDAPTRYAHWDDLRAPPPTPERTLPFSITNPAHFTARPSDRERPGMTRIELPSVADPRAVDPIVFNEDHEDGCNRLELHVDGSFACADYRLALGDGWRLSTTAGIRGNPRASRLST